MCVYMQAVANMPTNIHPSFSKLIEKAECIEIVSFSHITASTFNILHTIILYFFFVRIIHNIYNNYLFSIANEFQERKIQITVFFSFFLLSHKTKYETIHNIFSDWLVYSLQCLYFYFLKMVAHFFRLVSVQRL